MTVREAPVIFIKKHPRRDGLELSLAPLAIDQNMPYGAQITQDLFTPDPKQTTKTEPASATCLDGILGDPSDGQRAVLEINEKTRRNNARNRLGLEALGQGVEFEPVGTLYITE